MNEKIFVIDDELLIRDTIEEALSTEGFNVHGYEDPREAVKNAARLRPNLVITDLVMPEMDGIQVIHKLKESNPETNILVITGHASLDSAVNAIRAGANDYLIKPFKIGDLLQSVRKTLSERRLPPESAVLDRQFKDRYRLKNLIGNAPEMKEIFKLIEKVSKADSSVLILGESGTGKEMVARSMHYHSRRRKGPFVSINCAALPEALLESELFGHEKGAFTGASGMKIGLFELAEKGTFFLDEIGELSVSLQAKLLRVLQERSLKRVGGIREISVDFRLVAATSRNLPEEIKKGGFREDLYYRLNVIPILLPALRRRLEDIPVFIYFFLGYFAKKQCLSQQFKVSKEAMEVFQKYSWPGNVRELENVVERVVALSDKEEIDGSLAEKAVYDMRGFSPTNDTPIKETSNLRESVESYERGLIEKAIRDSHGNKNHAARKLHLTRQSLQYKLDKYGIAA